MYTKHFQKGLIESACGTCFSPGGICTLCEVEWPSFEVAGQPEESLCMGESRDQVPSEENKFLQTLSHFPVVQSEHKEVECPSLQMKKGGPVVLGKAVIPILVSWSGPFLLSAGVISWHIRAIRFHWSTLYPGPGYTHCHLLHSNASRLYLGS